MSNTYRKASWGIVSDPFYPDIFADGSHVTDRRSIETDLKPAMDPAIVPLYFDVYDWTYSPLLPGLSKTEGLKNFPTARSLPSDAPLFVLISGPSHSGLDSLANLVAYKAAKTSGLELIESCVRLEGRDPARNVLRVARSLVDDVEFDDSIHDAEALAKRMRQRLDQAVLDEAGRADATYSDLFRAYSRILANANRGIVVRILSGGDHDSWARIYKSAKEMATCVIVTTPEYAYAKTCYDAMTTDRQNVTWIRAQPVDLEGARRFVLERLAVVRLSSNGGVHSQFHPFTQDALEVLFERGTQSRSVGPVTHPVGWVRRTLHHALEDALQDAKASVPANALDTIETHAKFPFRVDAGRVTAARAKLNRGAGR